MIRERRSISASFLSLVMTIWMVLSASLCQTASAQPVVMGSYPQQNYFLSYSLFSDGDFRRAMRSFSSSGRIKTPDGFWIDSVCQFAMVGECLFQMGQTEQALKHFDEALNLFLIHQHWMLRLDYPPLRASARSRQPVPWAQRTSNAPFADIPETINSVQGQINITQLKQGETLLIAGAQYYPLQAEEIQRCMTLALRRRNEILGLAAMASPLTERLAVSMTNKSVRINHWSQSWHSLQHGLILTALGQKTAAIGEFQKAVLLAGQFEHSLTSVALVELGKIAYSQENYKQAAQYFLNASISAGLHEDPLMVEESLRWGAKTHAIMGLNGVYPPLVNAVRWAHNESDWLETSLLVSAAESAIAANNPQSAATFLNQARAVMRRREMQAGEIGARIQFTQARVEFKTGNQAAGDVAMADVLKFQKVASPRLIQVRAADSYYKNGAVDENTAGLLFEHVLRDPSAADWADSPRDCLAYLLTPQSSALQSWLDLVLGRKEYEKAIEITDRFRRQKFYSTLPMGGRMMSLRWVLESPDESLTDAVQQQRRLLVNKYPVYGQLQQAVEQAQQNIDNNPVVPDDEAEVAKLGESYGQVLNAILAQETLLREMALEPNAADMMFPPIYDMKKVKNVLDPDELLLTFFMTSRNIYAISMSQRDYGFWRIASPNRVKTQISVLLRSLGNFGRSYELDMDDLQSQDWRTHAETLMKTLTGNAPDNLFDGIGKLTIVPDGFLWYLPFELLPSGDQLLIEKMSVKYAPTGSLVVGDGRNDRPMDRMAVGTSTFFIKEDEATRQKQVSDFIAQYPQAEPLGLKLPGPSSFVVGTCQRLIVFGDLEGTDRPSYNWAPVSSDRANPGSSLAAWFSLPWSRCEQVILPGFRTAAEDSMKRGGTGDEIFYSICGLMASGARTVVLSRWKTAGQSTYDLNNEFFGQMQNLAAADAWRAAVDKLRMSDVDAALEPRLTIEDGTKVSMNHPYFWAGYVVVDAALKSKGPSKLERLKQGAAQQGNANRPVGVPAVANINRPNQNAIAKPMQQVQRVPMNPMNVAKPPKRINGVDPLGSAPRPAVSTQVVPVVDKKEPVKFKLPDFAKED